jgi:hypothetical protein
LAFFDASTPLIYSVKCHFAKVQFIIQNRGNRDLLILKVIPGCGSCVGVTGYTKEPIPPNKSGFVKLTLVKNLLDNGKIVKEVLVTTNTPKSGTILTLEAEIVKDQKETIVNAKNK